MAKQQAGEDTPRRRGKTDRSKDEAPEELASHFDLDLWPVVPEQNRPRRVIFDTLYPRDIDALAARGYEVVLLRLLPRRTPEEDDAYLVTLMQGVSDGTVALSKGRSEGLSAELKARTYGTKKELKRRVGLAANADLKRILDWNESRHKFGGNTTMVSPEHVQAFLKRAAEDTARVAALEQKAGKKR